QPLFTSISFRLCCRSSPYGSDLGFGFCPSCRHVSNSLSCCCNAITSIFLSLCSKICRSFRVSRHNISVSLSSLYCNISLSLSHFSLLFCPSILRLHLQFSFLNFDVRRGFLRRSLSNNHTWIRWWRLRRLFELIFKRLGCLVEHALNRLC